MDATETRHSLLSGLALAALALYVVLVALPAVRGQPFTFATYYTASSLLTQGPQQMERIYDDAWFDAQIARHGFVGLHDIFNIQPPTMSLMVLPLLALPPRLAWPAPGQWGGRIAGLALGLMLMLKSAGSWLWPLLLLSSRWRILAWAVALAIVLGLAALPWVGAGAWASYIGWLPALITSPKRLVTAYQTTTSLFGHLLVYDARWNPAPVADLPLLAWALTLATLLLTLAISARAARLTDGWQIARALTLALWLAPIVASAPYGEGYHYTMVLPALLFAIWWAWRLGAAADRWTWGALALVVLLLGAPLPYKSARLEAGWLALLAYPRVYGAYLLWFVLVWMIRRASDSREGVSG